MSMRSLPAEIEAMWRPGASDQPITLSPSRLRWLAATAVCTFLLARAIERITNYESSSVELVMGWLGVVCFGYGVIYFFVAMLPGASGLKLRRDGFTVVCMFQPKTMSWVQNPPFRVGWSSGNPFGRVILFESPGLNTWARFWRSFFSSHVALPESYGVPAETLVNVMNDMRWRAIAAAGGLGQQANDTSYVVVDLARPREGSC